MAEPAVVRERFFDVVLDALENDHLTLPTLPEVALKIREHCESPDSSDADLAAELAAT
jgi:HD-like signal output (HDOD) protein